MSIGFTCFNAGLPSVDEAIAVLRRRIAPLEGTETVPLAQAAGRILAQDVTALTSMPPWDRSAMDGYAFGFGTGRRLRLVGKARPGQPFVGRVQEGECVAIATGATLPAGCDSVEMQENCEISGGDIVIGGAGAGRHVRKRGEDFQAGDKLATAGLKLEPRHLALLASAGLSELVVRPRLRVAVFSIGDELLQGGIHDANRIMLLAQCAALGARTSDLGILPDDRDRIAQIMGAAAATHDMVICSAGTSAGDEDHARGAVLDCGGEILLAGVAIKPGRPVSFARIGACLGIALPGNPAAAFVTMAVLGTPLLRHRSGETAPSRPWPGIRVAFAYAKKPGHREYLRVTLRQDDTGIWLAAEGAPINSAALAGLAQSDALVCLDEGLTDLRPGMTVPYCRFSALADA